MTNKERFIEAHKMTRNIVNVYAVDYRTQFSICLKFVKGEEMEEEKVDNRTIEQKLEDALNEEANLYNDFDYVSVRCNFWANYGKERTYYSLNCYRKGKLKKTVKYGFYDHKTEKYVYEKPSRNLLYEEGYRKD